MRGRHAEDAEDSAWLGRGSPDKLHFMPHLPQPLTADDLLPLVARLAPGERDRLVRLIDATSGRDASVYGMTPPGRDEFSSNDEPLAWNSEGWGKDKDDDPDGRRDS
jgi:hypothetical protein